MSAFDHNLPKLPRWRCHKVVSAVKIGAMNINADGSAVIQPSANEAPTFRTCAGWEERYKDPNFDDPGYFVLYDDGYQSWSPTEAFENGYTRME